MSTVDDSGQDSTGVYQGNVTLSLDNPTWHNDLLYLSYNDPCRQIRITKLGRS
ncbi:ShlB/FhaC/HecB family hemolysin secretion/activation protein [Psychrobacter celer]|uniref:ShlB/FhaC/HecB family hemolysin secretion/activation protein n=1 Tax=Psychrobacter celer TaxID=306572 RepID=UPI003FD47A6E